METLKGFPCPRHRVPITLPALRERAEDVPSLCQHFLASANRRTKRNVTPSAAVLVALQLYNWPGNVRELQTWWNAW